MGLRVACSSGGGGGNRKVWGNKVCSMWTVGMTC